MKYGAKGTIEAVQLNDPLEVANWVKQNVPEWRLKALNEDRVWFKIEGNPHATYYRMDGRWMLIGDGGVGRPSVVSNELFQAWYEPVTKSYASGGYIFTQAAPGEPVITPLPSMMYDMPRSRPVEGVASAWEKK